MAFLELADAILQLDYLDSVSFFLFGDLEQFLLASFKLIDEFQADGFRFEYFLFELDDLLIEFSIILLNGLLRLSQLLNFFIHTFDLAVQTVDQLLICAYPTIPLTKITLKI